MFKLQRRQIQPIGLDIGHDSVKLLQLEVVGDSLRVHAAARQVLDVSSHADPDLVKHKAIEAIIELMRGDEFHDRQVVAALPRQIVHVKNLRLPPMPMAELATAVQFESRNIFPFDTSEAQVDFVPAGEVRQGNEVRQEVVVLAVRRIDVDRYIEYLHRAKLVVESLDVEACALYRSIDRFVRRREDEQEVHVLIDMGMQRSHVVIGRGREISFFKPIDVGGAALNEAVSRKLAITVEEARALRRRLWSDDENTRRDPVRQAVLDATRSTMENLAKEISLCLRYYSVTFRGQRPNRVRLLGGEAADPQLLSTLNSVLNVPVEAGCPLFSVDCAAMKSFNRAGPSGEWALALGLGLRRTEKVFAPMDGTPRGLLGSPPASAPAEVVDLNASIGPNADQAAKQDQFAAVRRATQATEVTHA